MKVRHPDTMTTIVILAVLFVLSLVAFVASTAYMEFGRAERREVIQREVNGNSAMIFAVCRAFKRRDTFEAERLATAKKIEFEHESMTRPFSPVVKDYFRDRRAAIARAQKEQKQKFVEFDCIKGMEKAYLDGYASSATPNGKPPSPPAHRSPTPRSTRALF